MFKWFVLSEQQCNTQQFSIYKNENQVVKEKQAMFTHEFD